MPRQRFRIRFKKQGNLKFIGHIDLMRTLEMLFRRCQLPMAVSEGFHPKPRMSFPCALPLGYESTDEVLDIELEGGTEVPPLTTALLNTQTVKGLEFDSVTQLNNNDRKVKLHSAVYEMNINTDVAQNVDLFLAADSLPVRKPNGKTVDARRATADLQYSNHSKMLTMQLLTQDGPEAGVREVLTALGLGDELFKTVFPKKIESILENATAV